MSVAKKPTRSPKAEADPSPAAPAGGMTVAEAGRRGGTKVRDTHGPEFYETIGRKGGLATKKARGSAYYAAIGKKGGRAKKTPKAAK